MQVFTETRLEAIEAGLFDNLKGKGKPLNLEDDSHIPPELRMAYRILKNADCLPPELELRKEIITLQDLVASMKDEAEKLLQMRRLNFLMMKMGMMRPVSAPIIRAASTNSFSRSSKETFDRAVRGPSGRINVFVKLLTSIVAMVSNRQLL